MFQVPLSWSEDAPNLGSKLVAIEVKLSTSELAVIVNIYRYC
jgi:hypothetical protein